MNRLLGAAAILLASYLTAFLRLRGKRERIRRLRALSDSLVRLRSELCERQRSLGEIFFQLASNAADAKIKAFFALLGESLRQLGERGFLEIWNTAVAVSFAHLGEEAVNTLCAAGLLLGGSELDAQGAALGTAARRLGALADAEYEALKNDRKLSFGLSLSAGAFLVIILM